MILSSQNSFFYTLRRVTKARLWQLGIQAAAGSDSLSLSSPFTAKGQPNWNPVLKEKGKKFTFKGIFRFRILQKAFDSFGATIIIEKLAPSTSPINADTTISSIELLDQYNYKATKLMTWNWLISQKIKLQNTRRWYFRVKIRFLIPCRF